MAHVTIFARTLHAHIVGKRKPPYHTFIPVLFQLNIRISLRICNYGPFFTKTKLTQPLTYIYMSGLVKSFFLEIDGFRAQLAKHILFV